MSQIKTLASLLQPYALNLDKHCFPLTWHSRHFSSHIQLQPRDSHLCLRAYAAIFPLRSYFRQRTAMRYPAPLRPSSDRCWSVRVFVPLLLINSNPERLLHQTTLLRYVHTALCLMQEPPLDHQANRPPAKLPQIPPDGGSSRSIGYPDQGRSQ